VSYIPKTLIPGETVLYRAHLHWIVLLWQALIGGVIAIVGLTLLVGGIVATSQGGGNFGASVIGGAALLLAGASVLAAGILQRNATEIAVTNKRVLIKTGFFTRKTTEIFLSKIESVVVDESFFGKTAGFGTVTVRGTGGTPEQFDRIANPLEFRRQVQSQIESGDSRVRSA